MRIHGLLAICLFFAANQSFADALEDKINAALASDVRTTQERDRDSNRKPLATLQFFGLQDDMRVVELVPGRGWYTKVLAPVLADTGKLYVALGTRRVEEGLIGEPGFSKVEALDTGSTFSRDGPFRTNNIDKINLNVRDVDMVLTFRNLHNFTPESRAKINRAVFAALKSGGLYGVVDHTARHMETQTNENRRRVDPVVAIKEILDAGFVLENFSDLHYRADDELRFEVGRKSVTGNTDRFTLLFRKP